MTCWLACNRCRWFAPRPPPPMCRSPASARTPKAIFRSSDIRRVPWASAPDREPPSSASSFFQTLRIPLLQGRTFDSSDAATSPGTIVVNEAFARKIMPGENPIGRQIFYGRDTSPRLTIVGVVANVRGSDLGAAYTPLYLPADRAIALPAADGDTRPHHRRSASAAARHRSAGVRGGPRSARLRYPHDERALARRAGAAALRPDSDWKLRPDRDVARGDGRLRRAVLPGELPDPRDRYPARHRRAPAPGAATRCPRDRRARSSCLVRRSARAPGR